MALFKKVIGIDLGTSNVVVYLKGKGIVLSEPSVVAINTETQKVVSVGADAKEMLGKTPGMIKAIRPIRDGVISKFSITQKSSRLFVPAISSKMVSL